MFAHDNLFQELLRFLNLNQLVLMNHLTCRKDIWGLLILCVIYNKTLWLFGLLNIDLGAEYFRLLFYGTNMSVLAFQRLPWVKNMPSIFLRSKYLSCNRIGRLKDNNLWRFHHLYLIGLYLTWVILNWFVLQTYKIFFS